MYILKCRLLHAAAFLQWRLKFPKKHRYNQTEIEETLLQTLRFLGKDIGNHKKSFEELEMPNLFKYKLSKPCCHQIKSFEVVGLSDPFGEAKEFPFKKVSDDVYNAKRYCKCHSPMSIYIPSNEMMLKMMRACIGVKCPCDLWF